MQLRLTDRKRAAIMNAAVQEFRAHGYDATSMDKLAAHVQLCCAMFFNYYRYQE